MSDNYLDYVVIAAVATGTRNQYETAAAKELQQNVNLTKIDLTHKKP